MATHHSSRKRRGRRNRKGESNETGALIPERLAVAIDRQRHRLFDALAVVDVVGTLLRQTHDGEQGEPHMGLALNVAHDILDDVIATLEPRSLGLPAVLPAQAD
jgi:hypothetical protein